ncbi:MAG: hypothetical protein EOP86_08175 [Verrucomicrobiaceae bacterium]|nr:MAG: hypothetical protein EOP86_08175 [Verrucomicrobiaceae bacterium]
MSIRNSHFEKCELPLSVVLRTKGCTFEDCRFEDDLPASAAPEGFTVSVVSRAPQNDPVLAKRRIGVKKVAEPAFRFWSPWTEDAAGAVTTGHRIAMGPEVSGPCEAIPPSQSGETTATAVEGAIFQARGVPLLFRAGKGTVEMLSKGFTRTGGTARFEGGGRVTWTDSSGPRTGWFVNEGRQLILAENPPVVLDRLNEAAASGKKRPGPPPAANDASDPADWLTGSTWEFNAKGGKQWLRFESPGGCAWVDAGGLRGGGPAFTLRKGGGVFVRDWPVMGASTQLAWTEDGELSFERDGGVVSGVRLDRDPKELYAVLNPAGTSSTPEAASAGESAEPAAAPPANPAPSAVESILKAKTSSMNALLSVSVPRPPVTAASGYRITASVSAAAGGFESPMSFEQFGPFPNVQAPVKKVMAARHQRWPSGAEISFSYPSGPAPEPGRSVTLPAALLMEGLYTGEAWDPDFAATGCLTDSGGLTRVSGLPGKLSAARAFKCRLAGVPLVNEEEVRDVLLTEGPAALVSLQVIGLETFDDAVAAARKNRTGKIQTAVSEFSKIAGAAPAGTALNVWLKSPPVQAQLTKVLAAEPRHLSAKILLGWARGKVLDRLSDEATVLTIQKLSESPALGLAIGSFNNDPFAKPSPAAAADLKTALTALNKLKPRCHASRKDLLDRLIAFGTLRLESLTKTKTASQRQKGFDPAKENEQIEKQNQLTNELLRLNQTQPRESY